MKRIILITLILINILCIFATITYAEKWIVACDKHSPPYNFIDEAGNPSGLDTELVQAVMDYLKTDYKIKFLPWKRVVMMTDENRLDLAYQWVSKPIRFEKYLMIGPLRSGKTLFVVRKDSKIVSYTTLESLKPYRIGMIRGYSYSPEFDEASYLKKSPNAGDYKQLLQILLAEKRVNMIIGDLHSVSFTAKQLGVYEQIRFLPKVLTERQRYVAFPKQKSAKAGLFAHGLNAIRENGNYDKILKKWQ